MPAGSRDSFEVGTMVVKMAALMVALTVFEMTEKLVARMVVLKAEMKAFELVEQRVAALVVLMA